MAIVPGVPDRRWAAIPAPRCWSRRQPVSLGMDGGGEAPKIPRAIYVIYWCLLMFNDVYWCWLMFNDVYTLFIADIWLPTAKLVWNDRIHCWIYCTDGIYDICQSTCLMGVTEANKHVTGRGGTTLYYFVAVASVASAAKRFQRIWSHW